MATVKLHTGTEVSSIILTTATMNLELLKNTNPIVFYELVSVARDPTHAWFGNSEQDCRDRSLHPEQPANRDIILASVTGDAMAMRMCNPITGM